MEMHTMYIFVKNNTIFRENIPWIWADVNGHLILIVAN